MATLYYVLLWLTTEDSPFVPPPPSDEKSHPKHPKHPNVPRLRNKK